MTEAAGFLRRNVSPGVAEALANGGVEVAADGTVRLFHATASVDAESIRTQMVLRGDRYGQAWLADSSEIAELHRGGGATLSADAPSRVVNAVVEVAVNIADLYYEENRPSPSGNIALFYLLDQGSGCPVSVVAVRSA